LGLKLCLDQIITNPVFIKIVPGTDELLFAVFALIPRFTESSKKKDLSKSRYRGFLLGICENPLPVF